MHEDSYDNHALNVKKASLYSIIIRIFGFGALPGKMMFVRNFENDKIEAYLGQVRMSKG